MSLSELITRTAAGWPSYKNGGVVNKNAELYGLVVADFPKEIAQVLSAEEGLKIQGSTGVGNVTGAPGVGVFGRSVTTSAQTGSTWPISFR